MSSVLRESSLQKTVDRHNVRPDSVRRPKLAPPQTGFRIHRLTYREIRRRLCHMLPGCLAFILHFVPHRDPVSPTLRWIFFGCCAVIGIRILSGFRKIQRLGEGTGTAPVAGYVLSVLLTVLLFPGDLEIALGVLAILAFGDGSATLFGLLLRGPRLPWNPAKSWSGLSAFVCCGTVMAAWIYRGETLNPEATNAPVTLAFAIALTAPAVTASAIAESIPSRINDNIRVGITSAVTLAAMHFLLT